MNALDTPDTPWGKPRILFVEDDHTLREHLAQVLTDEYVVETAGDGEQALKAVLRGRPDLIVTDLLMPRLDGVELVRTLRSTPSTATIPILMISGRAPDEVRLEGFELGADSYLPKPYTERELRVRIRSMLHGSRIRAEAARREANDRAEQKATVERAALLESITDAFYALDRQWRFTYVNQRALDYYGKSREELIGEVIWDVFPMVTGTVFQLEFERAMREQCSVAFELLSPLSQRWVDVHAYPTAQGLAINFRDITDRKEAEEALRDSERRKDEFLATLAHELRNPLAPIRNGLQILRLRASSDPTIQRTVNIMDRQMTHLVRLVDDLLDVSRISRGKLELKRQKVVLTDVLASAVEASSTFIETHGHELILDIKTEGLLVDGDANRLAQVFSNLLSNSAKYTDRGGQITLTLDRDGNEAVIRVADNGIGIPAPALENVFEMFSQVQAHQSRSDGGLGIGLALVRNLVAMHSGTVSASSEGPGKGSTFTVRLPVVEARPRLVAETTQPSAPVPSSGDYGRRRVLVVDDNTDAAVSLAMILELAGNEVRTAADGEEAVKLAREFLPDIIFMDIGMPHMDGLEATRRIRAQAHGQNTLIVALTGWGQDADRQRSRSAGIDHHLVKPVSPEALQNTMTLLDTKMAPRAAGSRH